MSKQNKDNSKHEYKGWYEPNIPNNNFEKEWIHYTNSEKTLFKITEKDLCKYSKLVKQLLLTFAIIYTVITLNNIENRLDNVQKSVIIRNVGKQTTNK